MAQLIAAYPRLGQLLDFLRLGGSDKVVVENHVRLQAQHLTPRRLQHELRMAVGEVIAEESGVFKMLWLPRQTDGAH